MRLRNKSPYTLHIGSRQVEPDTEAAIPDAEYVRWAAMAPESLRDMWIDVLEAPEAAEARAPALSRTPPKPKPRKRKAKKDPS